MRTSFEESRSKLVEWVEQQARLGLPEGNSTVRKNLEHVRKQFAKQGRTEEELNKQFPELVEVEVPVEVVSLKGVFFDLNSTRPEGMNGPLPITFTEMKSYIDLTDTQLSPDDISTLKRMDIAFLNVVHQHISKKDSK